MKTVTIRISMDDHRGKPSEAERRLGRLLEAVRRKWPSATIETDIVAEGATKLTSNDSTIPASLLEQIDAALIECVRLSEQGRRP